MKIERCAVITVVVCCLFCSITLFVTSNRFVNAELTPKWLGMMSGICIAGVAWSIWNRGKLYDARSLLLLLISGFLLVLVRNWITFGFSPTLFMNLCGLGLLFFLLQQTVAECPLRYFYGTIIVFAVALSLQGILRYAGVISSGSSKFAIIGSFDNPAGFAAALSCAFPFCFVFFSNQTKYVKYIAIATAALMAAVVFLSGSRSGMLAMVVAITVWFLAKSNMKSFFNKTSKIILIVAILALPPVLYFFKKDSADGRLLIWRCTLDMVADKPILGHGQGAFLANYMLYQAAYFNKHPDIQHANLAGNTLHPFNEYLLLLCEHGLAGFAVLALLCYLLIRSYRRNPSNEKLAALMSLLALAVFSFFSYPFRYPFTWMILFLNIAVICNPKIIKNHQPLARRSQLKIKNWIPRIVVLLLSTVLLTYTVMLARAEIKWNRIAHRLLAGQNNKVLSEYDQLYRWLGKEGLFLYNHAAELHEADEFERSNAVFERCTRYFNDMDVQMLMAGNYKKLGKFAEAEQHFKLAAAMFPAKFIPLYELVNLYVANNRKDEALALAKKIIDKKEKVISPTIADIKNDMRRLIERLEKSGEPENDSRTSEEAKNDHTSQGETPEVQPLGAALPP